ncbi:MAG: hypothetical protein KAW56_10695, partial [Candidatus Marinimicrobia bacterium]|nr:hypothetical protein [Candidatus Neomarinimicrobiota bacterium]
SYDPLEGLNTVPEHSAPALFEQKRIVQVIYEKDYRFAQPPKMPTLTATPGDGKVILTWDDIADTKTRDPFVGNVNDFEGYKLFRATDKKMSDVEVITDGYGTPMFKKPMFQCDLKDDRFGFTDFALVNGMGYNLGYDTGITHFFIDNNVQNGRTYYYAIVAYDYGAPDIGPGIAPSENNIVIELEETTEEVIATGKNVQIVTPYQQAGGYIPDEVTEIDKSGVIGTASVIPEILAKNSLKPDHTYKVKFSIDTLDIVDNYDHGIRYTNSGLWVSDQTDDNTMVYQETSEKYSADNLVYNDSLDYWHINTKREISTDVFDGLRINIDMPFKTAQFDWGNSGWIVGNSPMMISPAIDEYQYFPWDYDIFFTTIDSAYIGRTNPSRIYDDTHTRINRSDLITEGAYSFYVVNKSFIDSSGAYEIMDLLVHDQNGNGRFDWVGDRILVGPVTATEKWAGTVFAIMFFDSTRLPEPDDVYHVTFQRPFWVTDSLMFTVVSYDSLDKRDLSNKMDSIKVVPNP